MKCKYCEKFLKDDTDSVLNYFYHIEQHHYEILTGEEKMMHDIRKKMIESKNNYDVNKKIDGDSDLVFNAKNSNI